MTYYLALPSISANSSKTRTSTGTRDHSNRDSTVRNSRTPKKRSKLLLPAVLGCLVVALLIAIAVIVTLVVLYSKCQNYNRHPDMDEFGIHSISTRRRSSGDRAAAALISRGLDTKANPCEDFYTFACGNWSNNTPLPPGHYFYDQLTHQQHGVIEQLYTAFRQLHDKPELLIEQPLAVRTARDVFESCVKVVGVKSGNLNPLLYVMQNSILGIWPLLVTNWKTYNMQLSVSGLAGLLSGVYNVPSFITPVFSVDWVNITENRLFLDEATLTLGSTKPYLNYSQEVLDAYKATITAAAQILAHDANIELPPTLDADVMDIIKFEKKLAEIYVEHKDFNKEYNPTHIFQLKTKYPGIDWDNYFFRLLPPEVYYQIFPATQVVVMEPEYMKSLSILLQQTHVKILYNYLIWRLVHSRMWVLSAQFRILHKELKEKIDLRWQAPSHSVECIGVTTKYLGYAVGRLYVELYANGTKPDVQPTIDGVRNAFKELFLQNSWLDMTSKERALRKLDRLNINVGYPDWIMDDHTLNDFYRNLTLKPKEGFFGTLNRLTFWQQQEKGYSLLKGADRNDYFGASPALVNAWYSPEHNALSLPAGLLQPPIFRDDYPSAVRYGTFGTIVGHELMHGFDDQGIHFGPTGQLGTWLDLTATRGFRQVSACLVADYSRYCYKDINMCVDGEMTNGENLADVGGVQAAYRAYKDKNPNMKMSDIPGLEFLTNDQVFFLSYASVWCSAGMHSPALNKQLLLLNPHPPDQVRVLGTLRNFAPFGEAFRCSASNSMVSQNPCTVW